ncbi:MAG: hypothetical protein HOP17_10315 [Acidobacteria bacterium]|nr:hypothetical protein [Acidobacteriota bacterium]
MPKNEISELELIYYCQCIFANRYKYNYGRQANKTLKDILLPYQIPHDFLEVDFAELSRIDRSPVEQLELALNKKSWRYFYLNELFDITGTKTTPLAKLERHGSGSYPYVTTQETNNGVEGFYDFYTEEGNVLTVDSAVLGYCAYQPVPFSASDHVEKLVPRFEMNRYSALFIVTIINQEQYRYNYGRKCSHGRMEEIKIELPAKNARPDFEFMEAYIKSLPYSGSI